MATFSENEKFSKMPTNLKIIKIFALVNVEKDADIVAAIFFLRFFVKFTLLSWQFFCVFEMKKITTRPSASFGTFFRKKWP